MVLHRWKRAAPGRRVRQQTQKALSPARSWCLHSRDQASKEDSHRISFLDGNFENGLAQKRGCPDFAPFWLHAFCQILLLGGTKREHFGITSANCFTKFWVLCPLGGFSQTPLGGFSQMSLWKLWGEEAREFESRCVKERRGANFGCDFHRQSNLLACLDI